jgi:Ala-tRNA(Pro) deacylase
MQDLAAMGIACETVEHEAVFTVEESEGLHAAIPGAHTKNLFLKDAAGGFWLVTVPHDLRVDLKGLAPLVGAKKFSFAKAEDLLALLGLTPGSVTPLAAINDSAGSVRVVLDARLAGAARVNVHPLRNTATLGLAGADLLRALDRWGHPATVATVPERAL